MYGSFPQQFIVGFQSGEVVDTPNNNSKSTRTPKTTSSQLARRYEEKNRNMTVSEQTSTPSGSNSLIEQTISRKEKLIELRKRKLNAATSGSTTTTPAGDESNDQSELSSNKLSRVYLQRYITKADNLKK
jgi:hypothetical protein